MPAPTVAEVVALVERLYPPALAEPWDAVGLVCGDPGAPVRRILLAVDPTDRTALEALDLGADLVLTHHPLLLEGVHSVAATNERGRILHRLIGGGVALMAAHTNADRATPGVSDALARTLGLGDVRVLDEVSGLGRIGELSAAMALGDLAGHVAAALPSTPRGVLASGPLDRPVRTVAVCGGSGGSLADAADRAGADVLVTADLRYHRVLDHRADGACALIEVSHWASEWPWLGEAAAQLRTALAGLPGGEDVTIEVSQECTDPWTAHWRCPDA